MCVCEGGPLLAALVSGEAAEAIEKIPAHQAVAEAMTVLRGIFEPKGIHVPSPLQVPLLALHHAYCYRKDCLLAFWCDMLEHDDVAHMSQPGAESCWLGLVLYSGILNIIPLCKLLHRPAAPAGCKISYLWIPYQF